jgi:hypothetical protein
MNLQFALQKECNKHPSSRCSIQRTTTLILPISNISPHHTTKLLHCPKHSISQSIIHHHPHQTCLGLDTDGGGSRSTAVTWQCLGLKEEDGVDVLQGWGWGNCMLWGRDRGRHAAVVLTAGGGSMIVSKVCSISNEWLQYAVESVIHMHTSGEGTQGQVALSQ